MASETIQELKIKVTGDSKNAEAAILKVRKQLAELEKEGVAVGKIGDDIQKAYQGDLRTLNTWRNIAKYASEARRLVAKTKFASTAYDAYQRNASQRNPFEYSDQYLSTEKGYKLISKVSAEKRKTVSDDWSKLLSKTGEGQLAQFGLTIGERTAARKEAQLQASLRQQKLDQQYSHYESVKGGVSPTNNKLNAYTANMALGIRNNPALDAMREFYSEIEKQDKQRKVIGQIYPGKRSVNSWSKGMNLAEDTFTPDSATTEREAQKVEESLASKLTALKAKTKEFLAVPMSGIKKIGQGIKDSGVFKMAGDKAFDGFKTAMSKGSLFIKKLKGIALYRTIRALIATVTQGFREGLTNLYEYSRIVGTELKTSMDSLSSSALFVKNATAAMVGPLINIMAPVVERIADGFAEMANNIGLFIAQITGQSSFSKAVRTLKEYNKVQRQLLGFDEINRLNGSDDYASMFEEVSTEVESGSLEEKLITAILNGTSSGIGELLGEKLNSIIEGVDVATIGTNLGKKLDSGLAIAMSFLESFNFTSVGEKIASFFNNLMDNVDWTNLGKVSVEKFTSLFDVIYGWFKTFDWEAFGAMVKGVIIGWFDGLHEWVAKIDWKEFGSKVFTAIKDVLTGLDFGKIAGQMITLIADAITIAAESLAGFVEEAFESAGESLSQTFADGFWTGLKNIFTLDGDKFNLNTAGTSKYYNPTTTKTVAADDWLDFQLGYYANGGFPDQGELFIANESGPELVGTIGNRTAVTNQDQLVSAVAEAMAPVIQAIYATGSANVSAINNMPTPSIKIGDREIYQASQRGSRVIGSSLVQGV